MYPPSPLDARLGSTKYGRPHVRNESTSCCLLPFQSCRRDRQPHLHGVPLVAKTFCHGCFWPNMWHSKGITRPGVEYSGENPDEFGLMKDDHHNGGQT